MARRGKSAEFLRSLRKKFQLGEYAVSKAKPRSSARPRARARVKRKRPRKRGVLQKNPLTGVWEPYGQAFQY